MLRGHEIAGSWFPAGGFDLKKISWYTLLLVQEGTVEKLLHAEDLCLIIAITPLHPEKPCGCRVVLFSRGHQAEEGLMVHAALCARGRS
jgi:hypothetical protein